MAVKDGCGTANGEEAALAAERNCLEARGCLSSCEELAAGVQRVKRELS